jgi:hypothetical protein
LRRRRWKLAAVCAALWSGLAASPALADDAAEAREIFKRGVASFQKGDFATALAEFERADQVRHVPAITYNIARARESLGRAQAAIDAYEAYAAEAGEKGDFASAAAVAIAQIKARSTRLRIDTKPPGATVRIDDVELRDRTPVGVYVFRGVHRIGVELEDWKEQREYDAPGGGSTGELVFVRGAAPPATPPPSPPSPAPPAPAPPSPPPGPTKAELDGLMGGAALSLTAYSFFGSAEESSGVEQTTSDTTAKGLVFGLTIDVGYALSKKNAVVARGFAGFGSSESDLASIGAGGVAWSHRLSDRWWVGAGVVLGSSAADSDGTAREPVAGATRDADVSFQTDLAIGPTVELAYALDQNEDGQWIAALLPGLLVSTGAEQSTLFVPLVIGYRWF